MNQIIAAFLLGLSFNNLWICAILVFTLQTTGTKTVIGYIIGRTVIILVISLVLGFLGTHLPVKPWFFNFISGLLLILFAVYMHATIVAGWIPYWRRKTLQGSSPASCHGDCSSCGIKETAEYRNACKDCNDSGECLAGSAEFADITRNSRQKWNHDVQENPSPEGFWFGFSVGAFRGGAVCAKLAVLLPLFLESGVLKAGLMAITFSISSSIYPIAGFFIGKYALGLMKYRKPLFIAGNISLIFLGLFYLYRSISHVL
ncbi:hypothetical protein KKF34_00410 [Myxococcota bacterium]|nr:hypothetical protein [Myxococcota bacterium]MBU1382035.1 hypothetical protein [Myxococcota bacterium]MBU1495323.1 hypothetical protein [Myxococcota bacterium]